MFFFLLRFVICASTFSLQRGVVDKRFGYVVSWNGVVDIATIRFGYKLLLQADLEWIDNVSVHSFTNSRLLIQSM